jgi:HEAT repeat protein
MKWPSFLPLALLLGPCVVVLGGCANFFDEVSSRDFDWTSLWSAKPNPLVVLAQSSDGNKRAKALRALHEPAANGGAQKDQDAIVLILTTAATRDQQALCRLAAIKTLATFKDVRAVDALDKAFLDTNQFTPETNNVIKQQALAALGETGSQVAQRRLILVANEPPPAADTNEVEKQQKMDLRLTAIRALGKYNHYEVTETLVKVLKTEKDVAVRDRARDSLVAVTGKRLPADAKAWEDFLHQSGGQVAPPAQLKNPFAMLVGWWQ